jgi:methylglutaconyl-CoA hydratase
MIKYFVKNKSGVIILNRPEKRNALSPEIINEFKAKLIDAEKDEMIDSIIISGEGNSFCAGADLSYLNELKDFSVIENENDSKELANLFLRIYNYSKPTIAAVNGAAIAGGCGLASVCDFVIADELHSKFGYSEVKIGFIPAIVSIFLIRRVGHGRAKQMLLSGEILNGTEAYKIGLANYLSQNVLSASYDLADKLSKNSQSSVKQTKQMINQIANFDMDNAVDFCIRLNTISRSSEDFKQGLMNFLNKK